MLLERSQEFLQKIAAGIVQQYKDSRIDVSDLVQEGCLGLLEAVGRFDPEHGTQFLTYAVYWVKKLMLESVRIITVGPDTLGWDSDEAGSFPDLYAKSPEQIILETETYAELHDGLRQITARERTYLLYRYGFADGDEHPIPETAAHFSLTEKRARKTEQAALDDLRSKLPH